MLTPKDKAAWRDDGFFILPGLIEPAVGNAMLQEGVRLIRKVLPSEGSQARDFFEVEHTLVQPEKKPNPMARAPEDHVSKIFLVHKVSSFAGFAREPRIVDVVQELLGPDIDFVESQLIFKNPGAWGQPWHQDSFYFPFDKQPQVGVWLAISQATIENGCLAVLPGSHKEPIHRHTRDLRPGSNYGYLQISDHDFEAAVPVLMEPGDVLFFHSSLIHRSEDNRSKSRRAALVYHYTEGGTKQVGGWSNPVIDFFPVLRSGQPAL